MKLLTKEIIKRLPKHYETQDIPTKDKILQVKFFDPTGNWTWYGVEYDPNTRTFFGYVEGFDNEWGYFTLDELETAKQGHTGLTALPIERDICFDPCKFSELGA